jgi:transposase
MPLLPPSRTSKLQLNARLGRSCLPCVPIAGGEFATAYFIDYCAHLGVRRELTAPYTPQQNGVVERRNQTVVGTA